MRNIFLIVFSSIAFISVDLYAQQGSKQSQRPNIVLIMADDLGFSDIGCYGGEINTPSIDKLAANGIRYAQFYNAARCCPTRASLLTGLTPHRTGMGWMHVDKGYDGYHGEINSNTVTLAEALKLAGYKTAMAGKWHVMLGANIGEDRPKYNWPTQRGFDRYYGILGAAASYFRPWSLCDSNTIIQAEGNYYLTDEVTNHAIQYINEFAQKPSPFFMYVSYTAPHWPMHAREEAIKKYNGKFSLGWDSLRVKRFNSLMKTGLFPKETKLPPKDEQCYDWQNEKFKDWQQNRIEVYAAMIEEMDKGIGKIMEALKQSDQWENTVVIFLSDNGACSEEEGAGLENIPGLNLGPDSTFGSYGPQWAHLSATPFNRFKSWLYEGGIATPMIVQWPLKIKDKGGLRFTVGEIKDFMPTFLELANTKYPDSIRHQKTMALEGVSLVKSFINDDKIATRTLCWEHEGNRAIRKGKWKLVSEYPGGRWSTVRNISINREWKLYNMETDRTETIDLTNRYPQLVKELIREWEQWAKRSNVLDWKEINGDSWYGQ